MLLQCVKQITPNPVLCANLNRLRDCSTCGLGNLGYTGNDLGRRRPSGSRQASTTLGLQHWSNKTRYRRLHGSTRRQLTWIHKSRLLLLLGLRLGLTRVDSCHDRPRGRTIAHRHRMSLRLGVYHRRLRLPLGAGSSARAGNEERIRNNNHRRGQLAALANWMQYVLAFTSS